MSFRNLTTAGVKLVLEKLQSANYVQSEAGWAIEKDGDAQFDNLVVLRAMSAGQVSADLGTFAGIEIAGRNPIAELDALTTGSVVLSWGYQTDAGNVVSDTETGLVGVSAVIDPHRMWRIHGISQGDVSIATDEWYVRVRGTLDGSAPTLASPILAQALHSGTDQYATEGMYNNDTDSPVTVRALLTIVRRSGTGVWVQSLNTTYAKTRITIYDDGPALANTGWNQPGTAVPPAPPAPTPKPFAYTFYPTWDASYQGDGDKRSTAHLYQGFTNDSGGSVNGNQRSLIGFNYADIAAKLAGAVITEAWFYVTMLHSYYNSGSRVYIGTHNYTSEPGSWSGANVAERRITTAVYQAGDRLKVSLLGAPIADLRTGSTARGMAIGPAPDTSETRYCYLAGVADSGAPCIVVKGTK